MGVQKIERSRESFMVKLASKDEGTQAGYKTALNNFENYCMEKYGKADYISELKEYDNEDLYEFLQAWINWNNKRSPRTVVNFFSRVKKYLYHRGIKLDLQDIKEELDFPTLIEEELYPITVNDINAIFKEMQYKQKVQFLCQSSSLMRIGEMIQLKKKNLIISKQNIIVKVPATIAKFKKGRTTFFSKEASKLLRPLLREMDDNDLVFGSSENKKYSEINSEQILRRIIKKIGLDMRYETTNRFFINTHSFRAFGITKLSRRDPNFAKKLAGQKGYLLQYDRMSDEEKLELYEKYETDLIIDNSEKQKAEIKKLGKEKIDIEDLRIELDDMKKENSIIKNSDMMKEIIKKELIEGKLGDAASLELLREAATELRKVLKENTELKEKLKS